MPLEDDSEAGSASLPGEVSLLVFAIIVSHSARTRPHSYLQAADGPVKDSYHNGRLQRQPIPTKA